MRFAHKEGVAMTDLSVVILAKNEKLHIKRCLERLAPLEARQIFVVDCFSNDGTQTIVEDFGRVEVEKWRMSEGCDNRVEVERCRSGEEGCCGCIAHGEIRVIEHEWPGNQTKQFNWALDNLKIEAGWVLRLDADEYLYPDTIEEVKRLLPKWDGEKVTAGALPPDVTSLSLSTYFWW